MNKTSTSEHVGIWGGALKMIQADTAKGAAIGSMVAGRINDVVSKMVGPTIAQELPSGKLGAEIARVEGAVIGTAVGIVEATTAIGKECAQTYYGVRKTRTAEPSP